MSILTEHQKAAMAYDKHISLTANAGSGKTTVLSKRYVEILINENIPINNIVAISFTEKAASELYSKIANELNVRIVSANKYERYKLEAIRRSLVSAKISTIHSFCIDILKDYAPEAGIDANFSPVDSRTADELLNQSIDEVISSNLVNDSNLVKSLIRIFGNKSQLISKIKHLFNKRKSTEQLINELYKRNLEDIESWLENNFKIKFSELFEKIIIQVLKNIELLNNIAEEYKTTPKQMEVNRLLNEINSKNSLIEKYFYLLDVRKELLTKEGNIPKVGFLSKQLYAENINIIEETNLLFKEIKDIVIQENYLSLNKDLANFGKQITDFYIEINKRYSNKKLSKSYLDFEDLLLLTQKLLSNYEVKNALSKKYKYIMIDEYQDTNETQYNIFMPILKNLSTGNLFVVGDEKQSIYMFREAEVELFNQTKREIETKGTKAGILDLPHSFRLAPKIALFTNYLFRKLFENPNHNFNEVEYNELICAYPNKPRGKVEFLIANEESIAESELVARKINALVNNSANNYCFADFAILCTKRKSFAELENVFSRYGFPFSIVGGKGFFQQQLVLDIYNYISFLINPKNDLALASILRSPYFGLSDLEIAKISLFDSSTLFNKLTNFTEFSEIVQLLRKHINSAKILRTNELIREINNDTGYLAYISAKPNGKQEIANLEKLIQKAIHIDKQGFNTLFDFVNYLKDAINLLEDEGQADLDESENSIKILTVHQSKGLEFKIVILYKTNQKSFDEKLKAKDIAVDKNYGILSKLPSDKNYFEEYKQAPIIGIYNYVQKKKSLAEQKRLLYVAITRAEEHLIISLSSKNEKLIQDSFASMIFDTLNGNINDQELIIEDKLTFMKSVDEKYHLIDEQLQLKIYCENYIEFIEEGKKENQLKTSIDYNIHFSTIKSHEKNEIISASKISLFLNCPKKYELTYDFGYGELTKLFREEIDFEFSQKEEDLVLSGNLVGSIAHSILEKNLSLNEIEKTVHHLINKEEATLYYSNKQIQNAVSEISNILSEFYKSDTYKKLANHKNFFNEIEFYKREFDYYLYGILDKLIVLENKIIIVDYKTDKVTLENIEEKRETYLNQLKFYAYILLNKYPQIEKFELWLIFLRDDSLSFIETITKKTIEEFGKVIKSSVDKIRSKDFSDQKDDCKNMKYYLLDDCL